MGSQKKSPLEEFNNDERECLCSEREFFNKIILSDFLLLDAQPLAVYESRHLIGAQHVDINANDLAQDLRTLFKNSYAERKDIILVYTTEFQEQFQEMRRLVDAIKTTRGQQSLKKILILKDPLELLALRYPFLVKIDTTNEHNKRKRDNNFEDSFETFNHVYPCRVDENIFLGSEYCASQLEVLKHLNITYIVNVTNECKNMFEGSEEHKVRYHRFKINDSEREDITIGMQDCFKFIDEAVKQKGNVLIHCAQGRSRSPSIVIGYLMAKKGLTFEQAHEHVRESRDYLQINAGFIRQLRCFEIELN